MKFTMRILVILLAFLISACSLVQKTQIEPNLYNAHYDHLLSSIKVNPTLTPVSELRLVYPLTDYYQTDAVGEKGLFNVMAFENEIDCLNKANEILKLNYTSLNGHYGAMACSYESGNLEQARYHESVLNLLLESIWTTGNGESIDTAFEVINEAEKRAFIEFHGLEMVKQTSFNHDNDNYDLVTLKDARKNKQFDWYFTPIK